MEYTDYDTRLAGYAVIVDDAGAAPQVLLALWNEPHEGRWTLPGGGVELHETVEDGVVREVREETGYEVELTGILGVHAYVIPARRRLRRSRRPMRAVRVIYTARIVGGELRPEESGTTDEARWFPVSDVEGLPQVGLVEIGLDMWRDKIGT